MRRTRTFVLEIGDARVAFDTREMRWLAQRVRRGAGLENMPGDSTALAVLMEMELESRHPHPVRLGHGEVDALYPLAVVYADGYPGWEAMAGLRDALATERRGRGL